ncbi:hypothetical protein M8J76_003924 [Diaphorina citri]|nr:hypothetical protein M8J76_003924 [Diaphorina citri]
MHLLHKISTIKYTKQLLAKSYVTKKPKGKMMGPPISPNEITNKPPDKPIEELLTPISTRTFPSHVKMAYELDKALRKRKFDPDWYRKLDPLNKNKQLGKSTTHKSKAPRPKNIMNKAYIEKIQKLGNPVLPLHLVSKISTIKYTEELVKSMTRKPKGKMFGIPYDPNEITNKPPGKPIGQVPSHNEKANKLRYNELRNPVIPLHLLGKISTIKYTEELVKSMTRKPKGKMFGIPYDPNEITNKPPDKLIRQVRSYKEKANKLRYNELGNPVIPLDLLSKISTVKYTEELVKSMTRKPKGKMFGKPYDPNEKTNKPLGKPIGQAPSHRKRAVKMRCNKLGNPVLPLHLLGKISTIKYTEELVKSMTNKTKGKMFEKLRNPNLPMDWIINGSTMRYYEHHINYFRKRNKGIMFEKAFNPNKITNKPPGKPIGQAPSHKQKANKLRYNELGNSVLPLDLLSKISTVRYTEELVKSMTRKPKGKMFGKILNPNKRTNKPPDKLIRQVRSYKEKANKPPDKLIRHTRSYKEKANKPPDKLIRHARSYKEKANKPPDKPTKKDPILADIYKELYASVKPLKYPGMNKKIFITQITLKPDDDIYSLYTFKEDPNLTIKPPYTGLPSRSITFEPQPTHNSKFVNKIAEYNTNPPSHKSEYVKAKLAEFITKKPSHNSEFVKELEKFYGRTRYPDFAKEFENYTPDPSNELKFMTSEYNTRTLSNISKFPWYLTNPTRDSKFWTPTTPPPFHRSDLFWTPKYELSQT